MEKQCLLVSFSNLQEAKRVLGQIKKEGWNRTNLTVVVPMEQNGRYEFAGENFMGTEPAKTYTIWPGLKTENLSGVGDVLVGGALQEKNISEQLVETGIDQNLVRRMLREQKIVTLIEATPAVMLMVKVILEGSGADIQV